MIALDGGASVIDPCPLVVSESTAPSEQERIACI